jgi:hypothetical protein
MRHNSCDDNQLEIIHDRRGGYDGTRRPIIASSGADENFPIKCPKRTIFW